MVTKGKRTSSDKTEIDIPGSSAIRKKGPSWSKPTHEMMDLKQSSLRQPLLHTGDMKVFLVFVVIGFTVYGNSLNNPFIWDDDYLIVQNKLVTDDTALSEIFRADIMVGAGHHQSKFYRPLQILSYRIDYLLWSENPFGFHLSSTLLHSVNAFLVLLFIRAVFELRWLALFSSFLFLIHPVQTEAVTYIASRSENLMVCFFLGSLLFYRQYRSLGHFIYLGLSLLFFGCSLLSKEMAVSLPLIVLTLDLLWSDKQPIEDRLLTRYLPYFMVLFLYVYLRVSVLDLPKEAITTYGVLPEHYTASLFVRLLTFFKVLSVYIGLLVFPIVLSMERSISGGVSLSQPMVFGPLLITIVLMVTAYIVERRFLWDLLWLLISLLPVSGLVPINYLLAERYLYLPSVGFFCCLGILAHTMDTLCSNSWKRVLRPAGLTVIGLVFSLLMVRTVIRNVDWNDELVFYQKTLRYVQDSTRLHNNLGTEYGKRERYHEAIREFKQAIAIQEDFVDPHNNLGFAYYHIGDYDAAVREFARVVQLGGRPHSIYQKIVDSYLEQGNDQAALSVFLAFGANEAAAYNSVAMQYYGLKHYRKAITFMEKVIELDKYHAEAMVSLGSIYAQLNEFDRAREYWEQALNINPSLEAARICLQRLENIGRKQSAAGLLYPQEGLTDETFGKK